MRRSAAKKSSGPQFIVPATVTFVLFSSTLLLCDVAKPTPSTRQQDWQFLIDRILAVPIRLTDVSDLRWYACAVGLVILLFRIAVSRKSSHVEVQSASPRVVTGWNRISKWMPEFLAGFTITWACMSALVNGTWEQSRGYIFFLAMGLGWMLVLARVTKWVGVSKLLGCLGLLVVTASVLSLIHLYAGGLRFFQLPVGPITATASFGAFWGAFASIWIADRWFSRDQVQSARLLPTLLSIWVAWMSFWLLFEARRRGAIIGVVVSISIVSCAVLWINRPSRTARMIVVAAAALVATGVLGFVWQQSRSAVRETSISLRVRFIYNEAMARMIPDRPLFGYGPDMFICEMTDELAPMRSEMPNRLHGGIDADAHNEWFQAVFELGIPGGLAYAAIPCLIIGFAIREWARSRNGERRRILLAGAAALLCLFINELSSVNLRSSTISPWYWTMLGILLGVQRRGDEGDLPVLPTQRIVTRVAALAGCAVIIWSCFADIARARAHGMGRSTMYLDPDAAIGHLSNAKGRFGTSRWLSIHDYCGTAMTNLLQLRRQSATSQPTSVSSSANAELAARAVKEWNVLYTRCPAYLKTGFQLAQAQDMAGDTAGAVATLKQYLSKVYPYDRNANLLLMRIGNLSAQESLHHVLCAIKWERWEADILQIAQQLLAVPEIAANWTARVDVAQKDLANANEEQWHDPLAIEVLRLEAFRLIATQDLVGAEKAQMEAARAIESMASRDSKFRRPSPAEADIFYLAARLVFDVNPRNYMEAYRRIDKAEKFAIRELTKDTLSDPIPGAPYVGGKVLPVDPPPSLRDVWRFSAQMLMAIKADPKQIMYRVAWSLPPERQSAADLQAEMGAIAAELVQRLSVIPEQDRPASYGRLVELADSYRRRQ